MSHSFGLDANSALEALEESVERFKKDDLNKDLARDCAIKAWHLCEHFFNTAAPKLPFADLRDLQIYVRGACPELAHLQVICNAAKHGEGLRNTGKVKEARYHGGAFSRDFSRDFDVSRLEIELTDGKTIPFDDVVNRALAFWSHFFSQYGLK